MPREESTRSRVLLVGPGPHDAGGIAVVVGTLLKSPLAERFELVPVSTYVDASRVRKALRALEGVARAAWLLVRSRVDLVYLHTSSGYSFRRKAIVAALARARRRPYVVHVHAGDFDRYYRSARAWEQWLTRRTLAGASGVIVLSPSWERRIAAVAPCLTTAVPNPVTIPREGSALDAEPARLVCLGRLGDEKGSRTLVRALALLEGSHPDLRLTLAGDGDKAAVEAEAERLGVAERVDLPGWIDPDERHRTLLSASVFALPAREEGLPVALLEAMAYGLPVVASPVGGIPDVLEDGRQGFLVPPDDEAALAERILTILDDPALARELGRRARADAQARFAVDVVASRIGDVLEAALSGTAAGQHDVRSRSSG